MRTDKINYGNYCNLLPSASLCRNICEIFKTHYSQVFEVFSTNIYPYKRVDLNTTAIPALMIYPNHSSSVGDSWYDKSTLSFDFIYPGGAMIRERSTEIANVMAEAVKYLVLKNNNFLTLLKFGPPSTDELTLGQPTWGAFPALVEIGEKIEGEFSDINSQVRQHDSVRMTLKVSYTVDTTQWWDYIQEKLGHNVFNPCEFLYPYIADYLAEVNLQSSQTVIPEENI